MIGVPVPEKEAGDFKRGPDFVRYCKPRTVKTLSSTVHAATLLLPGALWIAIGLVVGPLLRWSNQHAYRPDSSCGLLPARFIGLVGAETKKHHTSVKEEVGRVSSSTLSSMISYRIYNDFWPRKWIMVQGGIDFEGRGGTCQPTRGDTTQSEPE